MNLYLEKIKLADKTIYLAITTERYDKNPKIEIIEKEKWDRFHKDSEEGWKYIKERINKE